MGRTVQADAQRRAADAAGPDAPEPLMSERSLWGIAAGGFLVAATGSLVSGQFTLAVSMFVLACAMFVFTQR